MRKDEFFDENQDVLRAIEFEVVRYYRLRPELVDNNVEKVYNGLQRVFDKEVQDKKPPKLRFTPLEQELYDRIDDICRVHTNDGIEDDENMEELLEIQEDFEFHIVSKTVIIQCMKRLRKSIKTWSGNTYGIRGYLDYISNFM